MNEGPLSPGQRFHHLDSRISQRDRFGDDQGVDREVLEHSVVRRRERD